MLLLSFSFKLIPLLFRELYELRGFSDDFWLYLLLFNFLNVYLGSYLCIHRVDLALFLIVAGLLERCPWNYSLLLADLALEHFLIVLRLAYFALPLFRDFNLIEEYIDHNFLVVLFLGNFLEPSLYVGD